MRMCEQGGGMAGCVRLGGVMPAGYESGRVGEAAWAAAGQYSVFMMKPFISLCPLDLLPPK